MIASYTFPQFPEKIRNGEKIHTFRSDPGKRWKVGMTIHHWWGSPRNPKGNPYQIQEDTVTQVLEARIVHRHNYVSVEFLAPCRYIYFVSKQGITRIANQDGLSYDEFVNYFVPNPGDEWVGRCIVWGKPY